MGRFRNRPRGVTGWLAAILLVALVGGGVGCGGGMPQKYPTPIFAGTTHVTFLVSSFGGDDPVALTLGLASLALKNQNGQTFTVFNEPNCATDGTQCLNEEFIHRNGRVSSPLVQVAIPEGIYTSAAIRVDQCGADILGATAAGGGAGSIGFCSFGAGNTTATASVVLTSPLTITGAYQTLNLQLQTDRSIFGITSDCFSAGPNCSFTLAPVFTLAPIAVAQPPTSIQNGLITGINGQAQTVSATSLQMLTGEGATLTLAVNGATQLQGVDNIADLMPNTYIQADAALQADGSLLATRIEVDDAQALYWTLANAMSGVFTTDSSFIANGVETLGTSPLDGGSLYSLTSNTAFKTDAAFINLARLPFTPVFNAQTMVGGQTISLFYSQSLGQTSQPGYPPVRTVVLEPQSLEGAITAVTPSGQFTVYTISLNTGDLLPEVQPIVGPFPHPLNAATVYAYADASTLMPAGGVTAGSDALFRGLLFDDQGTLRMDCERILVPPPLPAFDPPAGAAMVRLTRVQILPARF
ncbi:MAG: DUF5666 domain-containing protein [Terriglobales bacterium]